MTVLTKRPQLVPTDRYVNNICQANKTSIAVLFFGNHSRQLLKTFLKMYATLKTKNVCNSQKMTLLWVL